MKSHVGTGEDKNQGLGAVCLSLGNDGDSHHHGRDVLPVTPPVATALPWPKVIKILVTRGFELWDLGAKIKKDSKSNLGV